VDANPKAKVFARFSTVPEKKFFLKKENE